MGDLSPEKALRPEQRAAAALEAAGRNTEEIAAALGVAKGTITSWRKEPLYSVALDEIGRKSNEELAPIVNQIKVALVDGISKAIETLVENLEATDEEGRPLYSVRQAAASSLKSEIALFLRPEGSKGGEGDRPQAAAQSVVKVEISPDMVREGSPFHVIDADSEEETVPDAEVV